MGAKASDDRAPQTSHLAEVGRPRAAPGVKAVAATGIEALIARCGGDPAQLLGRVGIDPAAIGCPDTRLPLDRYCRLFELAARELHIDSLGLRFGLHHARDLLGPLSEVAFNSPTLGAALASLSRHFPVLQDQSVVSLRVDAGTVTLAYQIRDGRIVARRQDAELSIGAFLSLMRAAAGDRWRPTEILFEHAPPADRRAHDALLGAPVYFLAGFNAIRFPRDCLDACMPAPDLAALPAIERRLSDAARDVRPDDFIGRVHQEVRAGLATGTAALPAVAARLGLAEQTLYRRLRAHNVQYSAIVRGLRHDMARLLLDLPHLSLTDIALLLGYSELSAFTRAFHQWTGLSPSAFRQRYVT